MTWVVGFNGFNGVLCVADVQVTIEYLQKGRPPIYLDCLKKIHRLWDNAYVAFSGDVRVGLLLIADLQANIASNFRAGMLFTVEDRMANLQQTLRGLYELHSNGQTPELQLMFTFVHQPEESLRFQPAVCRFIAPDFRFNSSQTHEVDQCGSGLRSKELRVIAEFLAGRRSDDVQLYERIFSKIPIPPNVATVKKARTLLTSEAALTSHPGVSKIFCSVMAERGTNQLFSEEDHKMLMMIMREVGLRKDQVNTRADQLVTYVCDVPKFKMQLEMIRSIYPFKYQQLCMDFARLDKRADYSVLEKLPRFVEEFHADTSSIKATSLCTTWAEMASYMSKRGIPVAICAATA